MAQEIIIDIDPMGGVKIEVNGAQGTSCMDLTRELEKNLGRVAARKQKAEYYEQSHNDNAYLGQS